MNLVLVADVNNYENYHVGDEAMLEENIIQLRQRFPDATFLVISQDPDFTAKTYNVNSLPYFGFCADPYEHEQRQLLLDEIQKQAENLLAYEGDDSLDARMAVLKSMADCDALIISGGGNITPDWPNHLYQRVALLQIAKIYGKPAFILGQTFGSNFTDDELELLHKSLSYAQIIGVRDKNSIEFLRKLGIGEQKIHYQLDDAFTLEKTKLNQEDFFSQFELQDTPWIAVTVHNFTDLNTDSSTAQLKALATQLKNLSQLTGAKLLFVPHVAATAQSTFLPDATIGFALAKLLEPEIKMPVLNVRLAREVRWITSQASLIISTRYHPLVFGVAECIPALGIYVDDYTRIKLKGALEVAGLENWSMPMELACAGFLTQLALQLWNNRRDIHQHLEKLKPVFQQRQNNHWEKIGAALKNPLDSAKTRVNRSEDREEVTLYQVSVPENALIKPTKFYMEVISVLETAMKFSQSQLNAKLNYRNLEIASLRGELDARESMLTNKDSFILSLLAEVHTRDTMITEKDRYIASLLNELYIREAMIKDKDNYIINLLAELHRHNDMLD